MTKKIPMDRGEPMWAAIGVICIGIAVVVWRVVVLFTS